MSNSSRKHFYNYLDLKKEKLFLCLKDLYKQEGGYNVPITQDRLIYFYKIGFFNDYKNEYNITLSKVLHYLCYYLFDNSFISKTSTTNSIFLNKKIIRQEKINDIKNE